MKKLVLFVTMIFIMAACSRETMPQPRTGKNIIQKEQEEEKYEVIIFDNNFQNWMISNARPIHFYSNQYYRSWNNIYVSSWNEKAMNFRGNRGADFPFEQIINYDPSVDYGLEVNYKLYWYFRYIESVYGSRYNFPGMGRRGR